MPISYLPPQMPTLSAPSDPVHPESATRVWFFYSSCSACLPHNHIRAHTDFPWPPRSRLLPAIPKMRPPGPTSSTPSFWKLQVHHASKSSGPLLDVRALSPHVLLKNDLMSTSNSSFICKREHVSQLGSPILGLSSQLPLSTSLVSGKSSMSTSHGVSQSQP